MAKPRILCLHGAGTTAEIFAIQARAFIKPLDPYFTLVFADAPLDSDAGPGILPLFAENAPFKRWMRWKPHEDLLMDDGEVTSAIEEALEEAMQDDDAAGGEGEWVGLLGFSQGAKIAASVLYESELRLREIASVPEGVPLTGSALDKISKGFAGGHWRFAIVMAGQAPLIQLSARTADSKTVQPVGRFSENAGEFPYLDGTDKLALPSLHVHGLKDPILPMHRRMYEHFCVSGAAELVEWDGDHRVPFKKPDVDKVVEGILKTARRAGVDV